MRTDVDRSIAGPQLAQQQADLAGLPDGLLQAMAAAAALLALVVRLYRTDPLALGALGLLVLLAVAAASLHDPFGPRLKRLTRAALVLFGVCLLLTISWAVVGGLVVAMYLPIFKMAGAIGG